MKGIYGMSHPLPCMCSVFRSTKQVQLQQTCSLSACTGMMGNGRTL